MEPLCNPERYHLSINGLNKRRAHGKYSMTKFCCRELLIITQSRDYIERGLSVLIKRDGHEWPKHVLFFNFGDFKNIIF
jgi:hypothetical protein